MRSDHRSTSPALLASCALFLAGCGDPMPSPHYRVEGSEPVSLQGQPGPDVVVDFVREFGEVDGDGDALSFSRINSGAVSAEGHLAIADHLNCRVVVLYPEEGRFLEIGECGQGPEEYQRPDFVAWSGDTIVVLDTRRNDFSFVAPESGVVRRSRVQGALLDGMVLENVGALGNRAGVVGYTTRPPDFETDGFVLGTFDLGTGGSGALHLGMPPVTFETDMVAMPSLCTRSAQEDAEARTVVANPWSDQVLVLAGEEMRPVANLTLGISWRTPRFDSEEEFWRPPPRWPPALACGEEWVLVANRRAESGVPIFGPDAALPDVVEARWDFLSYDGRLLGTIRHEGADPDSLFFVTPFGVSRDRIWGFSNSYFGHPVIREYQVDLPGDDGG